MAEAIQKKLAAELEQFKALQTSYQKYISARQKLDAQLTENNMVLDEMKLLEDDSTVYKLVGPVLVKQDTVEATQNVEKRIKYISDEIKRHEGLIKEVESKQDSLRETITKLQSQSIGPTKA
ncbi:hypothetical protein HELRODRAFT_89869 [Helobdella robusta]|uniref:Prefoldin subunit 6 n=1 Tax=Helobdella robusta TaxID=6412 RepID=T1G7I5_HELRO|nr:hypothetical protein HELRODRAFT_89869 [Helobdella robusta]ESN92141.1 hypothetical protein HELRODRAFT_89869 [Helobdella robusta]